MTRSRVSIAAALALAGMAFAAPGLPASARPALKPAFGQTAAAVAGGAWTTYHHDNAHTGFDSTQPTAAGATAGWTSGTLDGQVYGEPLVFNGLVYVATLAGTVYALNQSTGATAWSRNVGAPQPVLSGQCGNVNPLGILGTPVIDTIAGRIYVSEIPVSDRLWHVYGIDLTSHSIVIDDIIPNTIGTGFDWTIEQQRGALALSKDRSQVYVPFGGRAGDCGPYHGWVVGVPTSGTGAPNIYESPTTAEGIWAAGGVVVDDATGNVLFATGNAIPCSGAVNSDSIIRTDASLALLDYFQPLDWSAHWCGPDWDLGSASPTIISPTLAFMSGKYGQAFLVNPTNLGGANGQLFPARTPYLGADVCVGNNADATFGSFAYAAPRIYLECENHGLVSLTVNTATPSFSLCDSSCTAAGTWQAGGGTTFGPPIVAGGLVWAVDIAGSGVYAFDAITGAQVYRSGGFGVNHFSTPSEAGGQVFVSAGTEVRSFNMGVACSSVSANAAPPSTATVGTPVTVTGTASPDCPNPRYEFWLKPPGGAWKLAKPYSNNSAYGWPTTGLPPGSYLFSVWARDAGSIGTSGTSPNSYDAFATVPYTLTVTACTSMSANAVPPSSAAAGTPVSVNGSATPCPNPRHEFWLKPPGGAWKLVKPYSAAGSFNWITAGLTAGSYLFSVWARDASSAGTSGAPPNTYDSFATVPYTLTVTACSSMTASGAPPSPSTAGTPVTISGTAVPCTNPLYEFWLLRPGGPWKLVQPYSNSSSYPWKTTGLAPGSYLFSVWARDASSAGTSGTPPNRYDTFATVQYRLT